MRIITQYLAGAIATIIAVPFIYAFSLLGMPSAAYAPVRIWCRLLHLVTGIRVSVHGLENVPTNGSYVAISNHCSHLDGPTLIRALPHPLYFIIKKELLQIPLWGPATVRAGFIAIDRGDSEKAHQQMTAAVDSVRGGRRILVFAEGTRSRGADLLPFKKGGFHLAIDAQVPILPIAINGSRRLLPKGAPAARSGTIEIIIGEPIPTTGATKDRLPEMLAETRESIATMRRRDPVFNG